LFSKRSEGSSFELLVFMNCFPANISGKKALTICLDTDFFEKLMVNLLEPTFPLHVGVAEKVILVLRGIFSFLDL
jgi:hypothetical protein